MDVDDELGLGELTAQALIVAGKRLDAARLGQCGIGLTPAFVRFQGGTLGSSTLLAPGGQMRGVDAFAAQQGADLSGLRALVGRRQDAALFVAGELAPLCHSDYLRIGARAG